MGNWDGRTHALDKEMMGKPYFEAANIAAIKSLYSTRADILDGIAALATDPGNESKTREINDRIGSLVDRWVLPLNRVRDNCSRYMPMDLWIETEVSHEMGFFQGLNNLGIGETRDQLIALENGLAKLVADLQRKWDAMTYGAKELEKIEAEANQKMNDIVQTCIKDATDAWLRVTAAANAIIAKFYKFPDHVNDAIVAAAKAAGIPDAVAEKIPKISLLGKDYFAAGKEMGLPAGQLAKANPELFRDPGMAVSEEIQRVFGPEFEMLIAALVQYHKCIAPLINDAYASQLNTVQSKVPNRGAILVSFTETRRDVDRFLDENGLDKARTIFENFDAALRMWPERVGCDGLYDDAKTMSALISEGFKRRFERMSDIFGVFVQANQGRFTGSVDKRTENELIYTDVWDDRERGVLARGMDQRLKAWRGDVMKINDIWDNAHSQLGVAMRAVPADLERSIDYALNRYLEGLRERVAKETEAASRTLESAADVVSDEKTARVISRAPMRAMLSR